MAKPKDDDLEFRLSCYLDGQLPRRERLALEKRLRQDEALREELRRYAALEASLAELSAGEVGGVDYDRQRAEILAAVERKALLAPPRRPPILLRPAFRVLTAAASILLAVSAGVLLYQFLPPAETTPTVIVEIPPLAPRPSGPVQVTVEISAPEEEVPLASEPESLDETPAGTILVCVSPQAPRPARLTDALVVY